jgi:type I restriction enzyme S subunit
LKFELKEVKLQEIANVIDSLHQTPNYSSEGYPMVRVTDIKGGFIKLDNALRVEEKVYKIFTKKYKPQKGDILMTRVGSYGNVALVNTEEDFCLGQNTVVINPKKVDSDFLFYYLQTPIIKNQIEAEVRGSTQKTISLKSIRELKLFLPPIELQKTLSSILRTLDDKIELNLKMNETLEEMAMTLYKHWFVDFGPFQDGEFVESELGMIPKGWEVSNVGSVTNIFDSLRVPLSNKEREKRKGIYPYYGATSLMDYVDDYIFDGTYLLVGEDGSVMKEDGTPYTQYVSGKFWVNNHAHVLQGTNGVSTEWLKVFFDNCNVAPYVTGAVQPKINQKNLKSIPFLLPPQNVRQEFNKNIKNLYEKILINNKENVQLETIRNYLLPRLLSGEIDVSQAEKQVEEVL